MRGGPTDLEPGTIIRGRWRLDERWLNIWAVVSEHFEPEKSETDLLVNIILCDPSAFNHVDTLIKAGEEWWCVKGDGDTWQVGKRPPAKFWEELAKWRLLGEQED